MASNHYKNSNEDTHVESETYGPRHIPASDCEPSQSSAIPPQLAHVDSSLEGEDHEDARLSLLRSPAAISDSEDHPGRNFVSSDKPTSYINAAASSGPMCRICHEGDQEDPLVSLCNCSGTMGFVHVSCLEHWLNERNVDICELCGQRFPMAAQPGSTRRFFHYVSRNDMRLRRALLSDLFYIAMVTSVAVFSLVIQATAFKALERNCFVWKLVVLFVTGAFHGCCVTRVSNRLRRGYRLFMTWQLENPVRRIVAVASVGEVPDGRT
nr:E3 ubiquitin-protein ligase MARCHF3-like [Dermacentor andersoni]